MKLDLACGNNKQPGFIGVDIIKDGTQADIVHDLTKLPWPFESGSVSEVYCSHYLEHTPDIISFMEELWRILVPGGLSTFITPYYTSMRAWGDPTHVRPICEYTFAYYSKQWRTDNKLLHYPITCNFEVVKYDYILDPDYQNVPQADLDFAMKHFWNVVLDMKVVIKKI